MATSPYFNNFNCIATQDLFEDLTLEVIKAYGQDVRYIPRTIVKEDELFGEDILSTFDSAASIEAYIKSVDGFEGEGDFLSRFNLEIRDSITFTIARKRFDEIRTEKLISENGWNFYLESANTAAPSRQYLTGDHETCNIELEDGNGDNYTITKNRPTEGDLIYFPLVKKIFEIKFVEHEEIFYAAGRLRTYELRCELFEYSNERLQTGNTEIDAITNRFSTDTSLLSVILREDQANTGEILLETGESLLINWNIENQQPVADNAFFENEGDDIIDFSEVSPFQAASTY